jgi:hypothetical protein
MTLFIGGPVHGQDIHVEGIPFVFCINESFGLTLAALYDPNDFIEPRKVTYRHVPILSNEPTHSRHIYAWDRMSLDDVKIALQNHLMDQWVKAAPDNDKG